MFCFDARLARTLTSLVGFALGSALLAACGDAQQADELERAAMCDGGEAPDDYRLATGYVVVDVGAQCPDPADAQLTITGCSFLRWEGITCGLERVEQDQVLLYSESGDYVDVSSAAYRGYATDDLVDVCYYEGVFFEKPVTGVCR